jgi:hypothetical protein
MAEWAAEVAGRIEGRDRLAEHVDDAPFGILYRALARRAWVIRMTAPISTACLGSNSIRGGTGSSSTPDFFGRHSAPVHPIALSRSFQKPVAFEKGAIGADLIEHELLHACERNIDGRLQVDAGEFLPLRRLSDP